MIVLDASALVDVLVDQPTKAWVLDRIRGESLVAPAHQPAEVLSAVARLVRAGTLAAELAHDALAEAARLHQEFVVPTAGQLSRALQLQDRLRVLDALYVVVAQDHDAPLLTTDRRLVASAPPVTVVAPPPDGTG